MKNIHLFLMLTTSVFFATSCEDKVDLKLNLEEGQSYNTEMQMISHITSQGMDVHNTMIFDTDLIVEEASGGEYVIRATYDRIRVLQDNPMMGEISYDSAEEPDTAGSPMTEMFRSTFSGIIGESIQIRLNESGKVEEITGVDPILEKLGGSMTESDLSQSFEQMFLQFPDGGVKEGSTWDQELEITLQFPVLAKTTYTVEEITEDSVKIKLDGTFELPEGKSTIQGASIDTFSGTQQGTLMVARNTGWTTRTRSDQVMRMHLSQAGQNVAMDLEQQVIVRLKEE